MPKYKGGWQPISSEILPNAKWNSKTFFFPILNFHYVKLDFSEVTLQARMSLRTSAHIARQCNNAHFSQRWDKHCLIFPMVWYPNKHANFNFSLCACSLFSFALITPRHSWMTHSRMNQPSQIQPELFLDCPLRSFGVCLHSTRMLKHQRSCSSWHGQSKWEGRVEDGGKTGQRDDAMDHTGADTASQAIAVAACDQGLLSVTAFSRRTCMSVLVRQGKQPWGGYFSFYMSNCSHDLMT